MEMQLRKNLPGLLFHPFVAPATSLLATLLFAFLVILRFDAEKQHYLLYYFAPLVIPFVAYIFDRLKNWDTIHNAQRLIDIFVLVVSLMRMFIAVPFISGHALLLTYIALSTQGLLARVTAALILLEVFYIKIFLWNDFTFFGGAFIGILAAILFRWIKKRT
jgi:hypothetical protein